MEFALKVVLGLAGCMFVLAMECFAMAGIAVATNTSPSGLWLFPMALFAFVVVMLIFRRWLR